MLPSVQHRSKLHRVFALTTAFDLLATVFLTLTLCLLTFSPSLSEPFGDVVCSSSYAASSEDGLLGRSVDERRPPTWTTASFAFWGVETCEDAWQSTMLRVLVGCVVTIALRAYGTWVTWEANVEMRERELGWAAVPTANPESDDEEDDDSTGEKSILEKAVRRLSSSSSSRRPTLTPLSLEEARIRRQSSDGRHEHDDRRRHDGQRSQTLPTPVSHRRSRSRTDHSAHWVVSPATSSPSSSRSSSRSSTPSRRSTSSEPRLVFVPFVIDSHGHAVYEPSSPTFAAAAPSSSQPPLSPVAAAAAPITQSPLRQSDTAAPRRPKLRPDSRSVATPPSPPPPPYLQLSEDRASPALRTCTKPSDEVANRHSWLASQI